MPRKTFITEIDKSPNVLQNQRTSLRTFMQCHQLRPSSILLTMNLHLPSTIVFNFDLQHFRDTIQCTHSLASGLQMSCLPVLWMQYIIPYEWQQCLSTNSHRSNLKERPLYLNSFSLRKRKLRANIILAYQIAQSSRSKST